MNRSAQTITTSTSPASNPRTTSALAWVRRPRKASSNRPVWMEKPHPLMQLLKALFLIWLAVIMLFPFVYVVAVSLSSQEDVLRGGLILWPRNPTLDTYRAILSGGIVTRALTISVGLVIFGTLAKLVATTLLAYGLSRPSVPGSRIILFLVLGAFLFSPGIIPNYLLVKELNLLDSYGSLILPGLIGSFNLIILRNFFMNISSEIIEAARIDGASDLRVLFDVVLPLSKAVLAVIGLFYGVAIWNIFFNALLYINDPNMWPIQVVLRQYVLEGSALVDIANADAATAPPPPQTVKMAIVVIATIPILLVYPFLQRYFTKGVLTGAIKG